MASTFFAVARHRGLHGATYASSATGTLGKGEHGWAFRGLALSVRITVRTDEDRALAAQVADLAHKSCFIANSLKAAVVLDVIVYES
jgi:organic hydroperoxide reductase OsmC/OhrA